MNASTDFIFPGNLAGICIDAERLPSERESNA